jgi:hypothetical protein
LICAVHSSDNAIKNRFHAIVRAQSAQFPVPLPPNSVMIVKQEHETDDGAPLIEADTSGPLSSASEAGYPVASSIPSKQNGGNQSASTRTKSKSAKGVRDAAPSFDGQTIKPEILNGSQRSRSLLVDTDSFPTPFDKYCADAAEINDIDMDMENSVDSDSSSSSPTPLLMALSPVTVDEDVLESWWTENEPKKMARHPPSSGLLPIGGSSLCLLAADYGSHEDELQMIDVADMCVDLDGCEGASSGTNSSRSCGNKYCWAF